MKYFLSLFCCLALSTPVLSQDAPPIFMPGYSTPALLSPEQEKIFAQQEEDLYLQIYNAGCSINKKNEYSIYQSAGLSPQEGSAAMKRLVQKKRGTISIERAYGFIHECSPVPMSGSGSYAVPLQ